MAAEKESLFEGGHPKLKTGTGSVTGSRPVAESTWLIEFSAPELACAVEPGHFVMLRLPELYSPLLGRPFAVYRADAQDAVDSRGIILAFFAFVAGSGHDKNALA